jgi:hypothetical protein
MTLTGTLTQSWHNIGITRSKFTIKVKLNNSITIDTLCGVAQIIGAPLGIMLDVTN